MQTGQARHGLCRRDRKARPLCRQGMTPVHTDPGGAPPVQMGQTDGTGPANAGQAGQAVCRRGRRYITCAGGTGRTGRSAEEQAVGLSCHDSTGGAIACLILARQTMHAVVLDP